MSDLTRPEGGTTVADPKTRPETRTREPDLYRVLLHNDDYTTQEFVDWVLVNVFNHDPDSAHRIMLNVHMHGVGVAGIYPYEIAETKAQRMNEVRQDARRRKASEAVRLRGNYAWHHAEDRKTDHRIADAAQRVPEGSFEGLQNGAAAERSEILLADLP